MDFHLNFCAAHEAARMMMSWTKPKGMLRREVVYLLKPKPLRMRGPEKERMGLAWICEPWAFRRPVAERAEDDARSRLGYGQGKNYQRCSSHWHRR